MLKCKTTFVSGRQIIEVVVVNEIIDLAKSDWRELLMLKVDFEKAYDYVCWNYLRYILR